MRTSVTPSRTCAARLSLVAAGLVLAAPLAARDPEPVTDREPGVRDVATTPITDLNLAQDPIPPVLLAAKEAPYLSEGISDCAAIGGAIAELDQVLGPDLDIAQSERDRISAGRIAKSAVGSLIPFRSIIREISGAADHQREFEAAILAGAMRRAYLKGLGQQMGCAYPARPAFARVMVRKVPKKGDAEPSEDIESSAPDNSGFVSRPVVQPTPPDRRRR